MNRLVPNISIKRILVAIVLLLSISPYGKAKNMPTGQDLENRKQLLEKYKKDGGKNAEAVELLLLYNSPMDAQQLSVKKDLLAVPQIIYVFEHIRNDTSEIPPLAAHIADALGWMKDPRAIIPLRKALKDENGHIRSRAARALLNIVPTDMNAIKVLRHILLSWPDRRIRMSVAKDIRKYDPLKNQYLLKAAIQDKSTWVRVEAVAQLLEYIDKGGNVRLVDDPLIKDISLVVLIECLMTRPGANVFGIDSAIRMLNHFSDYFVGNEWVIKELEKVPEEWQKNAHFKRLVAKVRTGR